MPFKSEAQRRFMHANHPELAKEFEAATPKDKKLPERVERKKTSKESLAERRAKARKKMFPNR